MPNENPSLVRPDLEGESFFWKAGPTGILLFHGFTATTAEVRLLAEGLRDQGYSVMGPLLPGHGTKPADLNHIRWQDWADAAERSYLQLTSECPQVLVGGESMGALVALWLAAHHPEIRGTLLYAPALRVPALKGVELISIFRSIVDKHSPDDGLPWQGYPVYPLKGAAQLLRFQRAILPYLKQIHTPIRVYQGRLDTTIDPTCGQTILDEVGSIHKELIWMEQSTHCMILDRERQAILASTIQFIEQVTRGS